MHRRCLTSSSHTVHQTDKAQNQVPLDLGVLLRPHPHGLRKLGRREEDVWSDHGPPADGVQAAEPVVTHAWKHWHQLQTDCMMAVLGPVEAARLPCVCPIALGYRLPPL